MKTLLLFVVVILCLGTSYAQTRRAPAQRQPVGSHPARAEMSVVINDTGFGQRVLSLTPGRETHVIVQNLGKSPHGLRIRIGKQEFGPTQPIAPGQRVEFTFTPPNENGGMGEFYSPLETDKANSGFRGRVLSASPWGEGG